MSVANQIQKVVLALALTIILAMPFFVSAALNASTTPTAPPSFKLVGNELLRECPKRHCKVIRWGSIDATATIRDKSGEWYRTEVSEWGRAIYLDEQPYIKIVKLEKPIVNEGWLNREVVPGGVRTQADSFFQNDKEDGGSSSSPPMPPATTEKGKVQFLTKTNPHLSVYLAIAISILLASVLLWVTRNRLTVRRIRFNRGIVLIIGSLLLVFGATYFGITKYQEQKLKLQETLSLQRALEEKTRTAIEELKKAEGQKSEQAEKQVEGIHKQLELLKQQQANKPNTPNPYPSIVKKWAKGIVQLACQSAANRELQSNGSGTLLYNPTSDDYYVLTNYHVVATVDGSDELCYVFVYPNSPLLIGKVLYQSKSGSFTHLAGDFSKNPLDMAAFDVEPIDESLGLTDGGLPVYRPLSFLRTLALDPTTVNYCSGAEVGDQVLILGYPAIGGESLTVTEGIVAGLEFNGLDMYLKTSAKIERGNSGGAAVHVEQGCFLGIPTLAVSGELESIAFILPVQ